MKEMESTNDDFKLIKKSFEDTIGSFKVKTHKIYRVKERNNDETTEYKSDNLLLFHGTARKNAVGILERGFKRSPSGAFGPGVYLTASPDTARSYSVSRTNQHKRFYKNIYDEEQKTLFSVFVNEVLESEKLQVVKPSNNKCKYQSARYIVCGTIKIDSKKTYEKDSNGRKITSPVNIHDDSNHYVCHEKFVIPRYLVEFY